MACSYNKNVSAEKSVSIANFLKYKTQAGIEILLLLMTILTIVHVVLW